VFADTTHVVATSPSFDDV